MICQIQHKTGPSGNCLGYDFGDMLDKDQVVEIIDFANLSLPPSWISKLERQPRDAAERKAFKKDSHDIANALSRQFDALAACADESCKTTAVEYIYSFAPEDMDRGILTSDNVRKIIREHLQLMGVHGDVKEKDYHKEKLRNKPKEYHREAMYVATAHKGTNCYHVHVYTSRLDVNTFKATNIHRDKERNVEINYDLNMKYHLCEKSQVKNDLKRSNPEWQVRVKFAEKAAEVLRQSTDLKDYINNLRREGIRIGKKGTGFVYSTMHDDDGKGCVKEVKYSGKQLSACLKEGRLTKMGVISALAQQRLEQHLPFQPGEFRYIVHGIKDATIYCDKKALEASLGQNGMQKHMEAMRQVLLQRVMFVAATEDKDQFYERAAKNQISEGNYRLGSIRVDRNGDVVFGKEIIIGDPGLTDYTLYSPSPKLPQEIANVIGPHSIGTPHLDSQKLWIRFGQRSQLNVYPDGKYKVLTKSGRRVKTLQSGTFKDIKGVAALKSLHSALAAASGSQNVGVNDENDSKSEDEIIEEVRTYGGISR